MWNWERPKLLFFLLLFIIFILITGKTTT